MDENLKLFIAQIIIWVSLGIYMSWVILKMFGILYSPLIIEYLPHFTVGSTICGFIYWIGNIMR